MSDSSSDESSSNKNLAQSLTVYEKRNWLKVTFNRETKRIHEAPRSLEELKTKLLTRFPVLKILVEHPSRP